MTAIVKQTTLNLFGVPKNAESWYFTMIPAIQNMQQPDGTIGVVIAWDKPDNIKKAYGVFKNHEQLWRNLQDLPEGQRYAYEIVPANCPCKGYWDIEFVLKTAITWDQHNEAKRDTVQIMKAWITKLKHEVSKITGRQANVAVLDGSRPIDPQNPAAGIKLSYHVILANVAFTSNKSKIFNEIQGSMPTLRKLAESLDDLQWMPSPIEVSKKNTCAPDPSVYKDNQIFRCLSCSKRGGIATPLNFADPTTNLTDTIDPYDTFLTFLKDPITMIVPENPDSGKRKANDDNNDEDTSAQQKKKRKKKNSTSESSGIDSQNIASGSKDYAQYFIQNYPTEMERIQDTLQKLLRHWGDSNTKVEKLVRANPNLRYQCKNVPNRPCLIARQMHVSNTPIIWLDAPRTVNQGELSDHYKVVYNCKSIECQCQGIIGEIFVTDNSIYKYRPIFPPIITSKAGLASAVLRDVPMVNSFVQSPLSEEVDGQPLRNSDDEQNADTQEELRDENDELDFINSYFSSEENVSNDQENGATRNTDENIDEEERRDDEERENQGSDNDSNHDNDDLNQGRMNFRQNNSPPPPPDDDDDDDDSNDNDNNGERLPEEQCFNQSSLSITRDLGQEKIKGYGWSQEELKLYGIQNTYQAMKMEMEKTLCRVLSPNVMYLKFKSETSLIYDHYTYENMQKRLKDVFYYRKVEPELAPVEARFFPSWTDDKFARSYESIVWDPSKNGSETGPKDFNTWPGIEAEKLEVDVSEDDIPELVRPIISHIFDVVVNGVIDHGEWFLDWLANIVQRPEQKTQVPIVISGKQGVGKGIIIDFFRERVLGLAICTQIQSPGQDLFSRFANKHVNKVLIQIDEGDGLAKFADHLKNMITADKINYEIKGLMPMSAKNYLNIIITTNHERPVLVETSDRRYVLFKASDMHLKNHQYYIDLGEHLRLPKVAKAFYLFLMARDISKYVNHFQHARPVTDYYLQSRKASIPTIFKFVSSLINSKKYTRANNNNIGEVSANNLFKDFCTFIENGRFQSTMTSTSFGLKIKNVDGVEKAARRTGIVYTLNYDVIQNFLSQSHEYDEDITFD